MKTIFLLCVPFMLIGANAWIPSVRNPFELMPPDPKAHIIKDCMHIALDEGDFIFSELPQIIKGHYDKSKYVSKDPVPSKVCGLYISSKPDTVIEIKMKHINVDCESGGLMAFVDGWELNGQYFPSPVNHQLPLNQRIIEFCSDTTINNWILPPKKHFQSSQNAALLQYRIPKHGSFRASVRFRKINEPCNIMMHDASSYTLSNYGKHQNCSITALFPIVVSLRKFNVGSRSNFVDHDCKQEDRIEIGGSSELDTENMEKVDNVCGYSDNFVGHEKAVLCGVSSVHLISSGNFFNDVEVFIRQADENDLDLPNVICS